MIASAHLLRMAVGQRPVAEQVPLLRRLVAEVVAGAGDIEHWHLVTSPDVPAPPPGLLADGAVWTAGLVLFVASDDADAARIRGEEVFAEVVGRLRPCGTVWELTAAPDGDRAAAGAWEASGSGSSGQGSSGSGSSGQGSSGSGPSGSGPSGGSASGSGASGPPGAAASW